MANTVLNSERASLKRIPGNVGNMVRQSIANTNSNPAAAPIVITPNIQTNAQTYSSSPGFDPGTSLWAVGGETVFGGSYPGEVKAYNAMMTPLTRLMDLNKSLYDSLYGTIGNTSYLTQLLPQLQAMFGTTPEQRAALLSTYRGSVAPQRAALTGNLANQLAASGLGGGRAARAMADLNRGFSSEDQAILQQLVGADITGRQTAGQTASSLFSQYDANRQAQLIQALQNMTGLGTQMANTIPTAMNMFKSGQ